ncbi:Uncharacterised protein [Mycobacterium tuberculosis]|nr:Uncharacterised protein [Mycobacterium tuberculosis]
MHFYAVFQLKSGHAAFMKVFPPALELCQFNIALQMPRQLLYSIFRNLQLEHVSPSASICLSL